MKSNKNIIAIVAAVLAVVAIVAAIIIFREQIAAFFGKAKDGCDKLCRKINKPADYDDYADVDF